jgi:DNA-binding CsgD family transcriptional regulator
VGELIIGRQSESSSLTRFLDAVSDGPVALVLAGDAGIGKTVLWQAVLRQAAHRSYAVLSCRPAPAETRLSYAALEDLLDPVLDEVLLTLAPPRRRALEQALLRAETAGRPPNQWAVSRAALDILRHLALQGPALLAVDDVQWLDAPSSRVLEFVIRRLESESIGILVAVRSEGEDRIPLGLERALGGNRLRRLQLGPLPLAALNHLLRSRLGKVFPRRTVVRLFETSGGNPFFALEIGRALLRRGDLSAFDEALPVPENLRDVVSDRLRTLSASTRGVLREAAALSQPTEAMLTTAAEAELVEDALGQALESGIIEIVGHRIRFTHPLLASVLYSEAPLKDRRRLHRRLAEVVTEPEERARHLAHGAEGPEEAIASALDEAARRASARGAPNAAALFSEQSWRLTPPARSKEGRRRGLQAIDHHFAAGDMTSAAGLAEELLAISPEGPERASVLYRLGIISGRSDSYTKQDSLLQAALAEAGEDLRLRAEVEQELAFTATVARGSLPESVAHAQSALALAETVQDPRLLVNALVGVAGWEFLSGAGVQEHLYYRAQSLEEDAGPQLSRQLPILDSNTSWGIVLKWADDFDGARTKLVERYQHAVELGDESPQPFLLFHLSELECWSGNWALARSYAAEALKIARQSEQEALIPAVLYSLALVDAHLGQVDAARSAAEEALISCERSGNLAVVMMAHSVLGFIELSLGSFAGVHHHLGSLADAMAAMGAGEPGNVRFLANEIEALVGLGELEKAELLTNRLEESGRTLQRPWALGTGARCRGLVQAARGNLAAATASLERALHEQEHLPMPFELGRTQLVVGTIHRRAKHKQLAKEWLDRAAETFEGLGAPIWAQTAKAELRRVGLRPTAPLGLTPTEERVAELVAAGGTNREVAASLFMSPKTVDSNLSRIYRKLGVRSRTELARKLPPL